MAFPKRQDMVKKKDSSIDGGGSWIRTSIYQIRMWTDARMTVLPPQLSIHSRVRQDYTMRLCCSKKKKVTLSNLRS